MPAKSRSKSSSPDERAAVEPVRQALVGAMSDLVTRAKKAPVDEVSGILLELSEVAISSRMMLAAVRGQAIPGSSGKSGGSLDADDDLEPVQPMGLAGMLSGLSETVGTETFQEFLALARAWLKQNSPMAGLVAGPPSLAKSKKKGPTVIDVPDELGGDLGGLDELTPDLDFDALSVRARNVCVFAGWTKKSDVRGVSDLVLLETTKLGADSGRALPRIARELRAASRFTRVPADDDDDALEFEPANIDRSAKRICKKEGWTMKGQIRQMPDEEILGKIALHGTSRRRADVDLLAIRRAAERYHDA